MKIDREQIDTARSLVYAFARESEDSLLPVHINKLSNKANFFNFEDNFLGHLKTLELINETKQIKPNFWSIAPTRSVKFGDQWLIISSKSNLLIGDTCDLNDTRTIGRFSKSCLEKYPQQSLKNWMGVPKSLANWISDIKNQAKREIQLSSYDPHNIEYYGPWLRSRKNDLKNWLQFDDIKENPNDLYLSRTKNKNSEVDYFWSRIEKSGNYEAYFNKNLMLETMIGLEILNGCPKREMQCDYLEGGLIKIVPRFRLPDFIKRLLVVISRNIVIDEENEPLEYIIDSIQLSKIADQIEGVEIRIRK